MHPLFFHLILHDHLTLCSHKSSQIQAEISKLLTIPIESREAGQYQDHQTRDYRDPHATETFKVFVWALHAASLIY